MFYTTLKKRDGGLCCFEELFVGLLEHVNRAHYCDTISYTVSNMHHS